MNPEYITDNTISDIILRVDEGITKANSIINEANEPLLSKILRVVFYASEITLLSVIIPYLTRTFTEWSILWPCGTIFLGGIILRLILNDRRQRKQRNLAEYVYESYNSLKNVVIHYQKLERSYKEGDNRLESIRIALNTYSELLRIHIETNITANVEYSGRKIKYSRELTARQFKEYLLSLCKYISEIVSVFSNIHMRCGLLLEDPNDANILVPIVVYDRNDPKYESKHTFDKSLDFSGYVIKRFQENLDTPHWKDYARLVIEDVEKHVDEFDIPLIRLDESHRKYLKCIVGNIVYFRDNQKKKHILGTLNLDSDQAKAITSKAFEALQPYLKPAYRLLGAKLVILKKDQKFFEAVRDAR